MKAIAPLACLAVSLAFGAAQAQSAQQPKPPRKPPTKVVRKAAAAAAPAVASPEQLSAAEQVHYGTSECEFNQKIDLGMNGQYPGYVDLKYNRKTYVMKPVLSSTGAMRLEDVQGNTLLLQIANKSMLMNVKSGQRMVDDCVHEKQRIAHEAAKAAAAN